MNSTNSYTDESTNENIVQHVFKRHKTLPCVRLQKNTDSISNTLQSDKKELT